MDANAALDAILALRAIWEQKRGRVTLADLEILVRRCVRSRGAAALPPEPCRGRPWRATTRHEVAFEACALAGVLGLARVEQWLGDPSRSDSRGPRSSYS